MVPSKTWCLRPFRNYQLKISVQSISSHFAGKPGCMHAWSRSINYCFDLFFPLLRSLPGLYPCTLPPEVEDLFYSGNSAHWGRGGMLGACLQGLVFSPHDWHELPTATLGMLSSVTAGLERRVLTELGLSQLSAEAALLNIAEPPPCNSSPSW